MTERPGTNGVFTVDRDLVVISWDDWLADVTGIPAAEARGRFIGDLYPELRDRGMIGRLRQVAEGGPVDVLATAFHQYLLPVPPRNPRSSFDRMRQFVTLSPRTDESVPSGVVVAIEDVTDRFERAAADAEGIEDPDATVRLRTVERLGEREDPSLVAGSLADESWVVRRAAAAAIARSVDDHAVRTLVAAIRERHRDPSTLNAALVALSHSAADVVGPVSDLLGDADHDVRTYAALALGMLRDHRAVPFLIAKLDDPDENVRFHVLEALGRIGDRSAADAIASVAETRDFAVAFGALDALAAIGEPSVAPRLLPLLDDAMLAEPAVECIGLLGSEEVVGPLMQILGRDRAPVAPIAVALERIHDRIEEYFGEGDYVGQLARAAAPEVAVERIASRIAGASDEHLHALATVLGWLSGPGVDAILAPLLAHPAVGPHVADVLGARGVDAAPVIIAAGRDFSGDARRLAAVALRRIGWDVTTPLLITWLDDEAPVIVAAAAALGAIGDTRAFYPLLRTLGHPMATVRQAAVSALNSIGHADMPAVIATRLADPAPEVREAAARIAGYFGYPRCLERMIALCTDPSPLVRRVVVEALANYEDRAAWVAIANVAAGDSDPLVRAAAIRACADPRSRDTEAVLRGSVDDPNLWVRYHGIHSLARRARHGGALATWLPARLIERARSDAAPPVRIAAMEAIAALHVERGIPVLTAASGDPVPDIAAAAVLALSGFEGAETEQTLIASLDARNATVQRAAIDALGRRQAVRGVEPIARIAALSRDDLTRRTAITALARIASPASTAALVDLLAIRACRADASRALTAVTAETLATLVGGLEHREPGIRCAVIEILGRIKRVDTSRVVSRALGDADQGVRAAAAQALTRRDLLDVDRAISAAALDANATVREAAASLRERR